MACRGRFARLAAIALLGATALAPAARADAQSVLTGAAKVVDGDSLEIDGKRVRLHAIDAPEGSQSCGRGGARWSCGSAAKRKLAELIGGRTVTCRQTDVDDYGRIVAVCRTGSTDLGAALVESGYARAYRRYGDDYAGEEAAARAARRGLWAGEHEAPWEYRRRTERRAPPPAEEAASGGVQRRCPIKGNIGRNGERIYHVPGSSAYDRTRIDESRGERWFCSEREARAAGWRPPRG